MDEKKTGKKRCYAALSRETIQMIGEAAGHSDLPEDVAALLAEDVTYRLRELTQNSSQFMKHARRKSLATEDFNKALKNSDVQPVFGHGSAETPNFRSTREGDIHFIDDMDKHLCDIAASNYNPCDIGQTTVKATWLAVEGVHKGVAIPGQNPGEPDKTLSEDLLSYYDNITKALLENDKELMKIALVDLRTNAKIAPLLPYFVNFVSNGVKTVSHDIGQLTRLLHTVRALVSNQSLYLEPKPYLNMLVQGVLYCVIEPLAASINPLNDHWALRDYAARLLARTTNDWDSPMNHLKEENVNALQEVLYDLARPFCSHYGAVMGLIAFGVQAVEDILLPHLPNYWPHLHNIMQDTSYANAQVKADAHKVHGAMLLAAEYVILARTQSIINQWETQESRDKTMMQAPQTSKPTKRTQKKEQPSTSTPIKTGKDMEFIDGDLIGAVLQLPETTNPFKIIADLYTELYEYFGDSLSSKLPIKHLKNIYVREQKDFRVHLGDDECKKSGEELLEQLLKSATPERPPTPAEDTEMRVVSHSYGQVIEEMEFDEKSEPSERSEQSSRSSRSDRSHSDENLSFLGDDTDLTVKATVSDPAIGIKLTITKRPKKTSSPVPAAETFQTDKPNLNVDMKNVKQRVMKMKELFDRPPKMEEPRDVSFNFRFLGREQRCLNIGRRMQHSVCCSASDPILAAPVSNECHSIGLMMKPYGRTQKQQRTKPTRSRSAMHLYSSNISNVI